jgi:hypothetical protein
MPRLSKGLIEKVTDAEPVQGGFDLIKPGKYAAILKAVETKPSGTGKSGWNWEFGDMVALDGTKQSGKQWVWTILPGTPEPKPGIDNYEEIHKKWEIAERLAAGRIKAMFLAFGYSEDSDTDEMLGEPCILQIGIQAIKGGPRKGEEQNYVVKVLPFEDVDESLLAGGEDEDDDSDF